MKPKKHQNRSLQAKSGTKSPIPRPITPLIASIVLIWLPALTTQVCNKDLIGCLECNESGKLCLQCKTDYFLDHSVFPYKCIDCPDSCDRCADSNCTLCKPGFYKVDKQVGEFHERVCEACDPTCESCSERPKKCMTCHEYFKLVSGNTCVFKYTRLALIGLIVVAILIMLMIFLIVQCVCFEKPPERPKFGTILDKDPDLLSDHYKHSMKSIGVNSNNLLANDSVLSVVKPVEESVMNVSNASIDPVIGHLVPGGSSAGGGRGGRMEMMMGDQYREMGRGQVEPGFGGRRKMEIDPAERFKTS